MIEAGDVKIGRKIKYAELLVRCVKDEDQNKMYCAICGLAGKCKTDILCSAPERADGLHVHFEVVK